MFEMIPRGLWAGVVMALWASGCGPEVSSSTDAGMVAADSGAATDAGNPVDSVLLPDTGNLVDAGNPVDSLVLVDTGNPADAGNPLDAGNVVDTGVRVDAGNPVDTGMRVDAGNPVDTGMRVDAGNPLDAGNPVDSGVRVDGGTPVDSGMRVDVGNPVDTGGGCAFPAVQVAVVAPTANAVIETCTAGGRAVLHTFQARVTGGGPTSRTDFAWRTPDNTLAPPPAPPFQGEGSHSFARQVGGPMADVPPLAVFGIRGTWQFEVVVTDSCGRTARAMQPFTLTFTNRNCPNP